MQDKKKDSKRLIGEKLFLKYLSHISNFNFQLKVDIFSE